MSAKRAMYLTVLLTCLLYVASAHAQGNAAIQDHCYLGGTQAKTSGLLSTNYQQGIIPSCTITVYQTGTQNKAPIYSNITGTPLSNPFTANATSSADPGGWIFWAAVNQGYDIVMSGGISPNTYPTPVTLTDRYPSFQFSGGGGGGATPCGTNGQIQIANSAGTQLNCDPNFWIDSVAHTYHAETGNMIIGALSSIPRAIYDPMSTQFCASGGSPCGLSAAIAAGGSAPTQVIQAAIDYGECQQVQHNTIFTGMDIPLPAGVIINITGLKLWTHTSFGGPNNTAIGLMPILQHVDATQIMVSFHAPGDTIVCNGTTYNPQPSGAGGVLVHDIAISGMGAAATNTDIGVLLNAGSSAGLNIVGGGQIFGGPAVMGTGTSTFLQNMGQPGAQLEGCKTYNSGALPVSGFTLGGGFCGAVMNLSLDGGADNTYASDAQAFASGAAAGPCYPNCAAYIAEDSGGYDNDIFVQVSGVGVQYLQNAIKSANVRVDRTSREAIRIGNGHGIGGVTLSKVVIDTVCQDSALQPNYSAGLPTACYAIYNVNAALVEDATVSNSAGILGPSYVQCSVYDQGSGSAGASNSYAFIGGQGNVNSTNPNNRVFCGAFDNSAVSGRVYFPTMAPLVATTVNPDVNGVNNIALNGQTVTTITGGVGSQTLWVYGPGTLQQGSGPNNSSNANNILNLTGQNVTLASGQVVEYMQIRNLAQNVWRMVAGPPNQTPTHVNYAGNPTPSNPSLLDSYSTIQARAVPAFNLTGGTGAIQLFGPTAPSGQACFVQEALFPDNSHVVSAQSCTAVDISALTSGEIWVVPQPQATMNLWLVSNSEPNGIATGKYPAAASGPSGAFWNYTVVGAGGDGTTPVVPGDNDTGEFWAPFGVLLSTGTQPTCSAEYHNLLWTVQNATTGDTFEQCQQISGGSYAWVSFPQVTTTGATVVNYSGGVAVTRTPGTNVTSVTCTSSICTTARGNLSIVGGTATTGTIATIGFNDSPTSSLTCQVNQEGGTSWYGIGHTISGSTLTVTAANSVSGATFMVSWQCSE